MVTIKAGTPSHHGQVVLACRDLAEDTLGGIDLLLHLGRRGTRSCRRGGKIRAAKRQGDNRPKRGLVPVKRLELACKWFVQQKDAWSCRRIPMQVQLPKYSVTT
jgi:hypothetical protein